MFWLTNRELSCVHADRQTARPGRNVVTEQGPLPSFIKLPFTRECQRASGDDHTALQHGLNSWIQNLPSRDSNCVGFPSDAPPRMIQSATHSTSSSAVTRGGPNIFAANRASLSNAVGASVPLNFGPRPMIFPNRSQTSRTLSVSNPVTLSTNGGLVTCPNACKIMAFASPCQ